MSTIDFYLKDKIDEKLNTYLPLRGGVMTGRLSTQNHIGKNVDTGTLGLYGGSGDYTSGAYIELRGKTNSTNPGMFSIGANNGTDINILIGKPNGTLTWGGVDVMTGTCKIIRFDIDNGITREITLEGQPHTYFLYGGRGSYNSGYCCFGDNTNTSPMILKDNSNISVVSSNPGGSYVSTIKITNNVGKLIRGIIIYG